MLPDLVGRLIPRRELPDYPGAYSILTLVIPMARLSQRFDFFISEWSLFP